MTGAALLLLSLLGVPPGEHAAPPAPAPPPQTMAMGAQAPPEIVEYPSLKIVGFGDIDFSSTHRPEGARGFSEGQLVLHMASALSPHVAFFGEVSFTPRSDAGTGSPPAPGFNAEVERMILSYDRSDRLKLSLGRYHTPVNYWNTAFHHGQWLQTTITRPEMIQFGGRFLPVHFVGGLLEGGVPAGGWNLNYQLGAGNGRASVISRAGDAGDSNDKRAWLGNVFVKPDRPYGLQFGGSFYDDTVTLPSAREFSERIVSAHVVWLKEDPEFIAEWAGVRHQETGESAATWNRAYYVQLAYRLPWADRLFKPYYRFEHIGIDEADAVFAPVPRLDESTLGVRYDATAYAALKGEFRSWRRGAGTERNYGGFFQLSFTF